MLLILVLIFGLAVGSFINAVAWRLHEQAKSKKQKAKSSISIVRGRSMCPHCRHQLAASDLVPVFSWLWLRGRCRYCGKPISLQYPVVEALTAGLFVWSALTWDFSGSLSYFHFGIWLLLLTGLITLALYDLRWMMLPDRILRPLLIIALLNLVIGAIANRSLGVIGSHLLAATLAGLFFFALHWLGRGRWLGGGDVKLAILMGLILGTGKAAVAFFLGFNLAAGYSLLLIAARRLNRKDIIPFGPFLIAATIIAQLYGHQLFHWYIDLFLPY